MGVLEGQRALITGGASGLGLGIAQAYAAEGARVAIADIDKDKAEAALPTLGDGALLLSGDVSDSRTVRAWFESIEREWGGLEILVNNAGIIDFREDVSERMQTIMQEVLAGGPQKTALDATVTTSDEEWGRMLAVHLNGTFYCTREALRLMTPAGYGRIVNMASVAATAGLGGAPGYSAAKGGIISFTRAVAREVTAFGITVNAIAPGFIETPFLDPMQELIRLGLTAQIPLKRFGTIEEVVPTALLLADPSNRYMTGQVISPNGGIQF
jgi:3-oxoacyl-[acyl-carrier protein] reductase